MQHRHMIWIKCIVNGNDVFLNIHIDPKCLSFLLFQLMACSISQLPNRKRITHHSHSFECFELFPTSHNHIDSLMGFSHNAILPNTHIAYTVHVQHIEYITNEHFPEFVSSISCVILETILYILSICLIVSLVKQNFW